ncbi:hypothetical protein [Streptomyces sp. NBC_01483]|uniref:hypothetical protein n=1 Tax=Streptomyces sp. NBC_01483 TaxID=2903883 RepID=UPI002E3583C8|nr:hypothetical protein [Streptomyces sp. NBC_01483]
MIRDLVFVETARTQFEALSGERKTVVGKALLKIAQEANRHGVWQSEGKHRLAVTYEVHTSAVVVTNIGAAPSSPAGLRQPYQGMDMRHQGGGRWIHLNAHEE